jgi:hypothetical protein
VKLRAEGNRTPTREQFRAYEAAFDYFNRELFDGKLPPVMLNFSRKARSNGFYCPAAWLRGEGEAVAEISSKPDERGTLSPSMPGACSSSSGGSGSSSSARIYAHFKRPARKRLPSPERLRPFHSLEEGWQVGEIGGKECLPKPQLYARLASKVGGDLLVILRSPLRVLEELPHEVEEARRVVHNVAVTRFEPQLLALPPARRLDRFGGESLE